MPAPRLQEKKAIAASLATERKQEIEKGVKLAQSVDALREARAKEERDLEEFRTTTLKAIQIQIASRQAENEQLEARNKSLKEERILLEGPIDLVEAWREVHTLKEKNEYISDDILKREIDITGRENNLHEGQLSLIVKEDEVEKLGQVSRENLSHSEQSREEAATANNEAQTLLSHIELQAEEKRIEYQHKDEEIEKKQNVLELREAQVEKDRLDINSEKILLADRRATLDRGFEELRRKQNALHR